MHALVLPTLAFALLSAALPVAIAEARACAALHAAL